MARILNVIQCSNLGGMEKVTLLRVAGLKALGNEVKLISLNPLGRLRPLLIENGIPAEGLAYQGAWGWRSVGAMRRAFRQEPWDAVLMHGHNAAATMALGDLCRGKKILFVHYHHAGVKPRWQWRVIYQMAVRRFSLIAFVSDYVRAEAEEIFPPLRDISRTLRNPVELPALSATSDRVRARQALGLPFDVKLVGNAGWLIQRKRPDVFLQVAAKVAQIVPDAHFAVAGDGPLRPELEEQARAAGIEGRVYWLGWRDEISVFYKALDVLLFNSEWDALGQTPVEAVAHSTPVVASVARGGLGELLEDGKHLFLSAKHDTDWLAEKVAYLLQNPEEGRRMALAGRQHLAATCSLEHDSRTIVDLLGF